MNVLLVHGWWDIEKPGGVVHVMNMLAKGLRKRGHSVRILTNDWGSWRVRSVKNDNGIPIDAVRLRSLLTGKWAWLKNLAWFVEVPWTWMILRAYVRKYGIDVIHLHYPSSYQLHFAILRMRGGPPYVVTFHGGDTHNLADVGWLERQARKVLVERASAVAAVSQALAEAVASGLRCRRRIRCIYNGIDPMVQAQPEVASKAPPLPQPYFVQIGSHNRFKGQDTSIKAWALLRQRLPDVYLVLVGDGPLIAQHRRSANTLGIAEGITFTGYLPHATAMTVLRGAEGMVAPSRAEGFGSILLEAGLHGIPVICSDIAPFREILDDGRCGLMFPVDDAEALADRIVQVSQDPAAAKERAQRLRRRVLDEFSVEGMIDRYETLYVSATH